MVIDSHLHLNEKTDGTAAGAAFELNRQLNEAGINRAVVLHLESQPWSAQEFSDAILKYPKLFGFINISPDSKDACEILKNGIENSGFIGLKLHPRLQGFDLESKNTVALVKLAGELKIPVLIDAFPDGSFLMKGFDPLSYAYLARECHLTNIIWAHMGGHYVLDFMMLAKRLPNVYFDLSYSLLYFQNSNVPKDMIYAMRSMKFERVFYGSDYPDRTISDTLKMTLAFLNNQELSDAEMEKILYGNAEVFFPWNKRQYKQK